jgi:hypothetical protein
MPEDQLINGIGANAGSIESGAHSDGPELGRMD